MFVNDILSILLEEYRTGEYPPPDPKLDPHEEEERALHAK